MRNNLWTGVGIGLIAPLLAYLLTVYTGIPESLFPTKPFLAYLVAAVLNLLLMRVFYRKSLSREKIANGIILVTFLGMLVFLYFHKLNM